ncbi:MAG TPA: hypothetical protein VJN18_31845 [Polyangiaceae bacterium]|nr:hypothetical protein [Polyangiaceae bacterium]
MEGRTRRRVLLDTTPQRLGRWLALSVALHAPLTPVMGLLGLFRFLDTEKQIPTLPPITEIPLDILEEEQEAGRDKAADTPDAPEPAAVVEPAQPTQPDPEASKPKPKEPELQDAGAPDASTESDAGAAQDAGTAGDAGPSRRPGEGIGDPVAGIVGDKRVIDPNANVTVRVYNERVRQHPLGGRVGPLLRNVYQWRDFFGPTAIDPIRDIDRMVIIGPQLRDSREVIAILQFNIPQEKLREAVDALVARDPEGGWLDAGVPVARAHADRGERVFVFPSPQVLIVTPPSAQASAQRMRKVRIPGPTGDEVAVVKLATPWRAFLGLPVAIPKSIKSAELRLSPMPDGGVTIDLLAHDETEQLAKQDAEALTVALAAATTLDLGILGAFLGTGPKKFIQKGSFEADRADIRGEIVLTRAQVETLIDLAGGFLAGRAPRPRPRASAPALGAPAPATSGEQ